MVNMKSKEVDAYIANSPSAYQAHLKRIRSLLQELVPEAIEKISWGNPTYMYYGLLVQFATCKGYVGFYLCENVMHHFEQRVQGYTTTKSAIHFSIDSPLDESLIEDMIRYRMQQNESTAK